jgi:hypothetical protein
MNNKLSAIEAFNQLQANCDFVEKSVKKELPKKGRVNLLIFNFTALLSILEDNFMDDHYDLFTEFIEITKFKISYELNVDLEVCGNYIGEKMDDYKPMIERLAHRDSKIANTLISEFYLTELDMEYVYRLGLSLSYLTNLIVKIADNLK